MPRIESLSPPAEQTDRPGDSSPTETAVPQEARPPLRLVLQHRVYRGALATASHLPLRLSYGVARGLGRGGHLLRRRSLRINANVARALEAPAARTESWARKASELRACDELEAHLLWQTPRGTVDRLIRFEGLENLDAALAAGKGAILYSGHIWSKYTFLAGLADHGYVPSIVGYPPRDTLPPIDLRFRRRRIALMEERFGCRYLWMHSGSFGVAVKAANVLRRNGVVVMLVDLPHPGTAVNVSFLDGHARFSVGPALVAQMTGAPLLDFYVHRNEQWIPQIAEIGSPLPVAGSPDATTQRCAERLEAHVRRHPEHWTLFSDLSEAAKAADLRPLD